MHDSLNEIISKNRQFLKFNLFHLFCSVRDISCYYMMKLIMTIRGGGCKLENKRSFHSSPIIYVNRRDIILFTIIDLDAIYIIIHYFTLTFICFLRFIDPLQLISSQKIFILDCKYLCSLHIIMLF